MVRDLEVKSTELYNLYYFPFPKPLCLCLSQSSAFAYNTKLDDILQKKTEI